MPGAPGGTPTAVTVIGLTSSVGLRDCDSRDCPGDSRTEQRCRHGRGAQPKAFHVVLRIFSCRPPNFCSRVSPASTLNQAPKRPHGPLLPGELDPGGVTMTVYPILHHAFGSCMPP